MKHRVACALALLSAVFGTKAYSQAPSGTIEPLSLEAYLEQVRRGDSGYRAAVEANAGAELRSQEGRLIFGPRLVGNLQYTSDEKRSPFFAYDRLEVLQAEVGVQQQFRFGLRAKLQYVFDTYHYEFIRPRYFEGRPTIELAFPLLRNRFASELEYSEEQQLAAAAARKWAESYRAKQILAQAESAYWRLRLARENRKLAEQTVARTEDLRQWSARRARLEIGDRSDLLQAEAALEARKLSLRIAESEERSARQAFNLARGVQAELVPEELTSRVEQREPSLPKALPGQSPILMAKEAEMRSARAASLGARERNTASLDVYGSHTLNSYEATASDALSKSFSANRPTSAVGLRWSAPLDLSVTSRVREGYATEANAAEERYLRERKELESEWSDLVRGIGELESQLEIARKTEEIQLEKINHERKRLRQGRSTTYQVIVFEADYTSSRLARLQIETQLAQQIARARTYF